MSSHHERSFANAEQQVTLRLLRRKLPFSRADFVFMVGGAARLEMACTWCLPCVPLLFTNLEKFVAKHGLTDDLRDKLHRLEASLAWDSRAEQRRLCVQITALLAEPTAWPFVAGETWSDAALADLGKLKAGPAGAWHALLSHCQKGGRGKVTARWQKEAQ